MCSGSENIKSSMLQDNTFKDFIASGFACCNKLLKDGTKCNCALRVIDTTHNKSCGIFTVACTKVPTNQDKEPHVSTFRTQCITDGDFALNRLAVTAEFVTGGSLTQLHQREDLYDARAMQLSLSQTVHLSAASSAAVSPS